MPSRYFIYDGEVFLEYSQEHMEEWLALDYLDCVCVRPVNDILWIYYRPRYAFP